MPIYEEKKKFNGKTRYFISTYVKDENGRAKKITRRNKEWIGRNGYFLAQQEEIRLRKGIKAYTEDVTIEELIKKKIESDSYYLKKSTIERYNELSKIYIFPFFQNMRIYTLTTKDILKWHEWVEEKQISIDTKKKAHGLLSSSLDFAIKYYELEKNVASLIGNFKDKRGKIKEQIQFIKKINIFLEFSLRK